ncbi:MAG: hypothetical protein JO249_13475 [Acidobacteria bacterium]|nr:hypothetical protein [Acidobacteriota bacterium]
MSLRAHLRTSYPGNTRGSTRASKQRLHRNYTAYCNTELDKLFDQQSMQADQEKRRHLVWEIDKRLQEDGARPILYHNRFATCWRPELKGLTIMVNSLFNGWRMEDVWLDK